MPAHAQTHTSTHAPTHSEELWESAQTGRANAPMALIPIAAFCVKTGSRRRCARMFIPLLIHAPPTAPVRLPPVRYQIANPITELSVQFPSQGFIPSGGVDCAEMLPSGGTLRNGGNVYKMSSCVPPGRSQQNG